MEQKQETAEVTTTELRQILADESARVFDARSYLEYSVGHIPGSLNVAPRPGVELWSSNSEVIEIKRVVQNKAAPIVLYCNGIYCDRSKRLSNKLVAAGFSNVRRYQLGIPVWRALVGLTQIELDGIRYVFMGDKTAVWVDTRSAAEFATGTLPSAVNVVDKEDVSRAKQDGRLPMRDHNTRIIVFGADGAQARAVAEAITRNAFHNVSYFDGDNQALWQKLQL